MQIKEEWVEDMQIKEEWIDDSSLDDVLDGNLELFPGLSLPCDELCAELEDADWILTREAREIRNHDCMWAGLCISEKHERDSVRPERVILPATTRRPARVVAPTNARSLLLPAIAPPTRPPDRPDTPLSENELDVEFGQFGDLLDDLPAVVPSEVTGQMPCKTETTFTVAPNTDHCYYTLVIPPQEHAVHTDSLGVQTPSDSEEEEIDVETIPDRKPYRCVPSPVTINGTVGSMPTTPTPEDTRELQRTVSAIVRGRGRPSLGYERRKRKRRLSSGDYTGEYVRKAVKRKQYRKMQSKVKRRRRHLIRTSSSDSEVESTERRSIHNNLERQRRIHLRNAYEELRVLLPETVDNEKAAKVTILSCGAHNCQELEHRERMMMMEKAALKKHQERLREQLSSLRRSLAQRR